MTSQHIHIARPMPANIKKDSNDFICTPERPFDEMKATTRFFTVWHDSKMRGHDFTCVNCGFKFSRRRKIVDVKEKRQRR